MTDIKSAAQRARLKQALRDNLRRRKAQEKGRSEAMDHETDDGSTNDDSAGKQPIEALNTSDKSKSDADS